MMLIVSSVAMAETVDNTAPYVDNAHTVKIKTNGQEKHTYGAYQIFKGNLNAAEGTLSNIVWGSAMTDTVVTALKTEIAKISTIASDFTSANTAEDFAKVLGGSAYAGADAAKTQAFADALDKALTTQSANKADTDTNGVATINVSADGYYFFRDDAKILSESDTYTRFMLKVVNDLSVNAKDTVLTPDKVILKEDGTDLNGTAGVKQNDSSIGDVITYQVTIPVPNTALYKDHFVLHMIDTLGDGLTYYGNMSIKIDGTDLPAANYTTTVKNGDADFDTPTTVKAAVEATGGQTIKVVFNDFKRYVEDNDMIGKNIVITYNVVLNKAATFNEDSNDNTVHFEYSNNPNYEYHGDDFPDDTDVKGTTPNSKTRTFVTKLKLVKLDGSNSDAPLAGATFHITGNSWNHTLETGEKYELNTPTAYTKKDGETIEAGTYYKLRDGSYTSVAPVTNTENVNLDTTAQYESTTDTYVKVSYTRVVTVVGASIERDVTSDKNGEIVIEGIEQGTFTVTETIAPDGYNLDAIPHTLILNWTAPADFNTTTESGFSKGEGSDANWNYDGTTGTYKISIQNFSGTQLPSTGGIGTTIFYVAGSILVLAAAILLITKRRMGNND